ncbi:Ack1p Ecym_4117 [Eremothecium cymbalariae DBVPG|uniref:Activator of C kinase protein 1 n=1 Tax=Eremothecium cymbalariae (strain CBS 270.75 / DBVPG 7215 / KCTC 17166 / NRRL Y-17582) TaxID=931890 RepID=G8JT43_ERECY|nr:hypothetical protein Ecym_4117 [Eremothecium cymbalariae DBVPG\
MSRNRDQLYEGHINMYPPQPEQQFKRQPMKVLTEQDGVNNPSEQAQYPPEGYSDWRPDPSFVDVSTPVGNYEVGGLAGDVSKASMHIPTSQRESSSLLSFEERPNTWCKSPSKSSLDLTTSPDQHQERRDRFSEYTKDALHFYKVYEQAVKDSTRFTPSIQMKWSETLLEYAFLPDFVSKYSINGEKLKRELTTKECQKNKTTLLEHALKVLTKLIKLKYAPAIYLMGTLYSHQPYLKIPADGIVPENDRKALEYYKTAAKLQNSDGCYRAGVSYEHGRGILAGLSRRDCLSIALSYYEKGAMAREVTSGSCCSMYKLGIYQLHGVVDDESGETIVHQDVSSAIRWFERATEHHEIVSPQALFELAKIHEYDSLPPELQHILRLQNIHTDSLKALELYIRCALKFNYPLAQWKLGHCYEFAELHLPYNPSKSITWYYKAATAHPRGNAMAMIALSGWYLTGSPGVLLPNPEEAFNWAVKASETSERRLAKAEFTLGFYYEHSIGCIQDLNLTKEHYRRAAQLGHLKAIERLNNL